MKKVLAVLMTVTVLISCTVFSASAAVAYRPDFSNDNPVLSLGIAAWCVGLAIALFKRLV